MAESKDNLAPNETEMCRRKETLPVTPASHRNLADVDGEGRNAITGNNKAGRQRRTDRSKIYTAERVCQGKNKETETCRRRESLARICSLALVEGGGCMSAGYQIDTSRIFTE
jgi:hypothetical protein